MNPNPVDWGGNGCSADRPNRWSWDQILRNTGGLRITLTERANFQDGQPFGTASDNITIEPGQSFTRPTFVCLATSTAHTFRTDWSGSDTSGNRIQATGPTVTLRAK